MSSLSELADLLGISTGSTGVYGTPKKLLDNLERTESSGNANAINKQSGAMGAYQFMPGTVKMLAKQGIVFDPMNKQESRDAADQYIQTLVKQNGGDYKKALAQYGGFKTQDPAPYVNKVIAGVPEVATKQQVQPQQELNIDDLAKQLGVGATPATPATNAAQPTPAPQKAPTDSLGAVSTFLQNIGDAATFGTAKYAAALPVWAGQGGTYTDALKRVREINQTDREEHPLAAIGGQLTGGVANAVLTGGGSIPRQLATAAGGGAAQAYTESKDATLGDAATAGALSLGFASAGQAIASGLKWANGKWVRGAVEDANATIKKSNAATLGTNKKQVAEIERSNAQAQQEWLKNMPESGPVPPRPVPQPLPSRTPTTPYTAETYREAAQSGQIPTQSPVESFKDYVNKAKKSIVPTVAGAAMGAGAGYLLGDKESEYATPTIASIAGGVIGGAKAGVVNRQLQQFMLTHPGAVEGAVNATARGVGQPTGSYATQPEEMGIAPKSLLRQTIDAYDEKRANGATLTPEAADLAKELGI